MYTIFLGSSSVSMFTLIRHKDFIIRKFKGASIMGIVKEENSIRKQILKIISKYYQKIRRIFFCFGEVDLHFGYFHNLINRGIDMDTDKNKNFDTLSRNYLEFIDSLDFGRKCEKIIIGPFPNCELEINDVLRKQKNYNVIDMNVTKSSLKPGIFHKLEYKYQKSRFLKFHSLLHKYCLQYQYKFISTKRVCLNKNLDVKKCLVHKYNKLNIHLNWEPMIQELVNACGFKFIHFDKNFLKKKQLLFYDKREQRNQARKKENTKLEKKTAKKMVTRQKKFSLKREKKE